MIPPNTTDHVIVVGAGAAGLATALRLAPLPATVLAEGPVEANAATQWAQGGIAAALGADDSPDLHAADTLAAASGLGDEAVARRITAAAPGIIAWLARLGLEFDRADDGAIALGLEAAHGRRRIVHAGGDRTGANLHAALVAAARRAASIRLAPGVRVVDLARDEDGRVAGVHAVATAQPIEAPVFMRARAVVLATGGLGGLYADTTNPPMSVGRGIAMAARAGAVLRDLEFVQFHPTAIDAGADPMPLATEALRGEGAVLVNDRGDRFMGGVPGAELAPRDVVARAIHAELHAGRRVFLDARPIGDRVARRFPAVAALCGGFGIDPARMPIPVRPAAHYHMGGVRAGLTGAASLPGLYACGEVAATGLHGANRLASNSLLEALVMAGAIAEAIRGRPAAAPLPVRPAPGPRVVPADLAAVRRLMTRDVGVVRDAAGLRRAVAALAPHVADDPALIALLVAAQALRRAESRGAHARSDHPEPAATAAHADTTLAEALSHIAGGDADRLEVA